MRILSVDPGIMTGYCYAAIKDKHLYYHPFQFTDDVDDFYKRIKAFKPRYIVMESFEFRQGTRRGLELFPVQLIGVARLYETTQPVGTCDLIMQTAAKGKSYYSDTTLKKNELYKRGIPHGMDASRHLLQWITFGSGYQFISGEKKFASIVEMSAFDLEE